MRERRFICLAMPQTAAGQIRTVRRINHCWAFPIAKRSPAQRRDVGHKLIEARIDKINELQLEHRALSISGQSAGHAENCRFGQRWIENLLWEFRWKLLRQPEHAAFWIFDILTEKNSSRIFLEASTQSFVYRVADAVFAGRKDLLLNFRRRLCDVRKKLVRRRVLGFFRIGIFAPDAFLNLLIQLRIIFSRD